MKRTFTAAILALAALFATTASAVTFHNWTIETQRSPNLEPGCATHFGPGCDPDFYPTPPLDYYRCFPNEKWTGDYCGAPLQVMWVLPDDLPDGCPHRIGPGCEGDPKKPLTPEGCYQNERYILIDIKRPVLGGFCMQRDIPAKNAPKGAPLLEVQ